ncbi:hypothetical protein POM88_036399 [Heracleum sosnowskyi]|uniref:Uncharacterized protein n=1 Tax=Heracleum sosnowskyi TaxID=360622 RepID=A0AAD8MEU4_9APIA|nr:hypothetical protein POM88_036399 [Heracleum sosnowskyi]
MDGSQQTYPFLPKSGKKRSLRNQISPSSPEHVSKRQTCDRGNTSLTIPTSASYNMEMETENSNPNLNLAKVNFNENQRIPLSSVNQNILGQSMRSQGYAPHSNADSLPSENQRIPLFVVTENVGAQSNRSPAYLSQINDPSRLSVIQRSPLSAITQNVGAKPHWSSDHISQTNISSRASEILRSPHSPIIQDFCAQSNVEHISSAENSSASSGKSPLPKSYKRGCSSTTRPSSNSGSLGLKHTVSSVDNNLSPSQRRLLNVNLSGLTYHRPTLEEKIKTPSKSRQTSNFQLPASTLSPAINQCRRVTNGNNIQNRASQTNSNVKVLPNIESNHTREGISISVPMVSSLNIPIPEWFSKLNNLQNSGTTQEPGNKKTSDIVGNKKNSDIASSSRTKNLMESFNNESDEFDKYSGDREHLSEDENKTGFLHQDLWAEYMDLGKPNKICPKYLQKD